MKNLNPALQAHLDSGATTLCTCWLLSRRDGVTLGFTDHDRVLSFGGESFEPETGADGAAFNASADLSVDNSQIEGALTSDRLSTTDLLSGRYDGAEINVWRVNWSDPDQRQLLKKGVVGEIKRQGNKFVAEIRGFSHVLDQQTGHVYQRQCDALVGDGRCMIDLSAPAYRGAGVVSAIFEDDQRFIATGLEAFESGWFDHGALVWRSGANESLNAHVKSHGDTAGGTSLSLWLPSGANISIGDIFDVTAGCDKRATTCAAKFSNIINFRGFHLMPGNDFVVSYPLRGEKNDGGKR